MYHVEELLPGLIAAAPTALAIIALALVVNYLTTRALVALARRTQFTEREVAPLRRVLQWVILVSATILILGAFGVNMGGLWGVVSTLFAMVAIGFVAVWSVLSNSLCTLMIMAFRPFSLGDEIEFPGEQVKGRVTDLNFMYTTLEADDGTLLQVPNNLFFQKTLRRRRARRPVTAITHLRRKQERNAVAETAAAARAAGGR